MLFICFILNLLILKDFKENTFTYRVYFQYFEFKFPKCLLIDGKKAKVYEVGNTRGKLKQILYILLFCISFFFQLVIKKLVKRNIRDYERNLAANSKHNPKSVYSYINNKTNIKDSIKAIKMNNGNTSTDSLEIAETLNEFFASVFIKDDSTVVELNNECVTKC